MSLCGPFIMIEKPAKGIRGCLLYNMFDDRHFFRVYGETDPATGRKAFTDYRVAAEDIGVLILDGGLSFYEDSDDPDKNRLSWSSETLGHKATSSSSPCPPSDQAPTG